MVVEHHVLNMMFSTTVITVIIGKPLKMEDCFSRQLLRQNVIWFLS